MNIVALDTTLDALETIYLNELRSLSDAKRIARAKSSKKEFKQYLKEKRKLRQIADAIDKLEDNKKLGRELADAIEGLSKGGDEAVETGKKLTNFETNLATMAKLVALATSIVSLIP